MEVNITKSESFFTNDFVQQSQILNATIRNHLFKDDRIINIQFIEKDGQKRFWIYSQEK